MAAQEEAKLLAKNLRDLAEKLGSHNNTNKFSQNWSWQASTLDTGDLEYYANKLADRIDQLDWTEASKDSAEVLSDVAQKVKLSIDNNAQNVFAGPQASEAIQTLLTSVDFQVDTLLSATQLKRSIHVPAALRRAVSSASQRLDEATTSIDGIEQRISAINRAYEAAEKLPLTLEELESTVKDIDELRKAAAKFELASQQSSKSSETHLAHLADASKEADATLVKVKAAYRAATSQGLASAFEEKSKSLSKSVICWVIVLCVALIAAGLLAFFRIPKVLETISTTQSIWILLIRFCLGMATIAPPVWLAWVATKQIGQRFRLSEDYAYKAALSAAYEGYKAEAAGIDPLLEAELFATAIGRLDEIPLRLVETNVHGSPLHELLRSSEFREATKKSPKLRERVADILKPKPGQTDTLGNEPDGA